MSHRYVNDTDSAKDSRDEGPQGRLPPFAVDDVHQDGHPAERHEDGPSLEAENAPWTQRKAEQANGLSLSGPTVISEVGVWNKKRLGAFNPSDVGFRVLHRFFYIIYVVLTRQNHRACNGVRGSLKGVGI